MTSATRTAEQLAEQNLVNPEDALRHVPSTTIRKRYPGDRNALVGGRSFGTLQPSRADEALTHTLKAALALVDVRVLDHIVVAPGGAASMAELGLL